jgi:uncharacterized protein involved in response to NO
MNLRAPDLAEIGNRPYRLFFLGAALHAVSHLLLWLCYLTGGPIAARGNPIAWHGYELLFGLAGAIVSGFVLTAAANWTGRRTVSAPVLFILFTAWAVGRIAYGGGASPWLVLAADSTFLLGVLIALARVLIITGNRRNYRLLPIIGLLALGAPVFHLAQVGWLPDWRHAVLYGGADLLLLLMVIMGGRVIPFFTGRRLPALQVEDPDWLAGATAVFVLAAIIGGWALPEHLAAALAWFAACLVLARLAHWSPLGTAREPMLWILHAGYLWLALALFLRGGALAWGWMPLSTALHAIVLGGLGCLGLGMMARVALGHGGHEIRAPLWLVPAFVLVVLAPLPRLLSAWPAWFDPQTLYILSGGAWIVAFGIYVLGFAPILLGRRADAP